MVIVIVSVVAAIMIMDPLTFLRREQYRGEVRALYQSLQPGMTKEEVRRVMDSGKYPNLQFHRGDGQMWLGAAPLEFGAGNWVLMIEFQNEHVSALRVRTADGVHDHPAEAPADNVHSGESD